MGEHAREQATTSEVGGARSFDFARLRRQSTGIAAGVVRWVGNLFAVVLAAHVVLVMGGANPDNGITRFIANWANFVVLGFDGLFTPADPRLAVLVNYGIAAIFWLVIASLVVKIIHRLG